MEVGNLSVPIRGDLGPITADLEKLRALLERVGNDLPFDDLDDALDRSRRSAGGLLGALRPLVGALAGVLSVRQIQLFADQWSDLTGRVNLAAGSIEKGAAVIDRLEQIARRTYSSLQLTTESYVRNAQTLRDLGYSTQQTLDYTEALNNALVISGARADVAARVQEALGRALAVGALRGTELNTVIESGGRVAQLLATELNTTVSGLRSLGQAGKITGEVINNALTGNLELLREEADSLSVTVTDAFQLIANSLLRTIGTFDQFFGTSSAVANALVFVADNMQRLLSYVAAGTAAWLGYVGGLALVNSGIFTLNGLLAITRTALIRLGIGAIIIALGELVYQFTRLVEGAGGVGAAFELLGEVAAGVWRGIVTSAGAIPPGLESVWLEMRAGFAESIAAMGQIWNDFLATFEGPALGINIGGRQFDLIGGLDLSRFKADAEGAGNAITDLRNRAAELRGEAGELANAGFEQVSDALGRLVDVANKARETADLSGDAGRNRTTPETDKDAARKAERLRKAYNDLVRDSVDFIRQQELERQTIGLTELEAEKLRRRFELLTEARRAGLNLSPDEIAAFEALADSMAEAEHQTRRLQERYEFAKDVFKGFFTDLISDLRNGASLWEALGNAGANALQKIADKALSLALDGIFDLIFGAIGGLLGGGRVGNSLGGGLSSSIRRNENGTSYYRGGLSLVGERGPELLRLPAGSQVQPNNRIVAPSAASFGNGEDGGTRNVAIEIFVKDDGKIGAIARQEAAGVVDVAIREYDEGTPARIENFQRHPRMR